MHDVGDNTLRHTRILASAGSGKTYQLTNRFLTLTGAGADPRTILATTFTRLAAGEIGDRILRRLVEAANQHDRRTELAQAIGRAALSRPDVLAMLARIIDHMHRLNIRTIDSFFASINQGFALELGIPPGATVLDEPEEMLLRTEAMRLMLDEHDAEKMIELLRLLTQGSSERSVMWTIDNTINNLYEIYRDTDDAAWECVPERPGRLSLPEIADAINELDRHHPSNSPALARGFEGDCRRIRAHDWKEFLRNGIAKKIAAGDPTYSKQLIPESMRAAYEPLIDHALAHRVYLIRRQTIATRDLLKLFEVQFDRLKRRRHAVTFADLTDAMLRAADSIGPLDHIWYRIDGAVHHLLLDEFQDTSVRQWRAMRPIVEEIVANAPPDNTFFCVGDVKQSIYAWRDAEPDILDDLPGLLANGSVIEDVPMSDSWRSSPPVIDIVNAVFTGMASNDSLANDPHVAQQWSRWFANHKTHRSDLDGYAELRMLPQPKNGESAATLRARAAADLIAQLHQRSPMMRIGVLTRANKFLTRMLYELQRRNVPASSHGGGPLTDAAPVNTVLDLLRLTDHPDDTVSAFNVGTSPLGEVLGIDWTFSSKSSATAREALARTVRNGLAERGFAGMIARWTQQLAPASDQRQLRRLVQLAALAERFDERATVRCDDFVHLVEQVSVDESSPAPVAVMTIHQAKGLEFDAVVLPELESRLEGQTAVVVYERRGVDGPIKRVCRHMSKTVQALTPELSPLFDRQRMRTVRESLCMLYVAMTRARQGLYMLISPSKSGGTPAVNRISGLLYRALSSGSRGECIHQVGNPDWMERADLAAGAPPEAHPSIAEIKLQPSPRPRWSASVSPSHMAPKARTLRSRLHLSSADAMARGTAIHSMFQQITWLEDYEPDRPALLRLAHRTEAHRKPGWAESIVDEFLTMIKGPNIVNLLSLDERDADHLKVWRERRFARLIDGGRLEGAIDRLEVELVDGRPVAATVIDFKSDDLKLSEAAEHAKGYDQQITAYREAAAAFLNLPASSVSAKLAFVSIDHVATLETPEPTLFG